MSISISCQFCRFLLKKGENYFFSKIPLTYTRCIENLRKNQTKFDSFSNPPSKIFNFLSDLEWKINKCDQSFVTLNKGNYMLHYTLVKTHDSNWLFEAFMNISYYGLFLLAHYLPLLRDKIYNDVITANAFWRKIGGHWWKALILSIP